MAELPAFKPSGAGAQVDLTNILKSQIIAWGGYKSKLATKYKATAGTRWVNGHELLNRLDITWGISSPSSEMYKLLELLGFEKDKLQEMTDIRDDGDNNVESIFLDYRRSVDFEKEDFEQLINVAVDYIKEHVDSVRTVVRNNGYKYGSKRVPYRGVRQFGLWYGTKSDELTVLSLKDCETFECDKPEDDFRFYRTADPDQSNNFNPAPSAIEPNLSRLLNNIDIYTYKNGQNTTHLNSGVLKFYLAFLTMVEYSMLPYEKNPVYYRRDMWLETAIDDNGSPVSEKWIECVYEETFNFRNISKEQLKKSFTYYVTTCANVGTCGSNATDEEKESKIASLNFPSYLWQLKDLLLGDRLAQSTKGLFYYQQGQGVMAYVGGEYTMTYPDAEFGLSYTNLKKAKPDEFGYYMSAFMNIRFKQKKKSWIKRFIGGLIKAFLSLIDALIGIFLKIPILKQATEIILSVIGKMFNVSGDTARDILGQIILAIIMIVISVFVGPLMAGAFNSLTAGASAALTTGVTATAAGAGITTGMIGALNMALTYSSYAMQIYDAAMRGQAIGEAKEFAVEKANRDYKYQKMLKAESGIEGALQGTMGSPRMKETMDDMMYNKMFNPFYNFEQAIPADSMIDPITNF